jgi:cold shock CspA family protein
MQKVEEAWFRVGKGFGFIALEGSVYDVNVNVKALRDAGFGASDRVQAVEYETSKNQSDRLSVIMLTIS